MEKVVDLFSKTYKKKQNILVSSKPLAGCKIVLKYSFVACSSYFVGKGMLVVPPPKGALAEVPEGKAQLTW